MIESKRDRNFSALELERSFDFINYPWKRSNYDRNPLAYLHRDLLIGERYHKLPVGGRNERIKKKKRQLLFERSDFCSATRVSKCNLKFKVLRSDFVTRGPEEENQSKNLPRM